MGADEEILLGSYEYNGRFKAKEVLLLSLFMLVFAGWIIAGLLIPKYEGDHCTCRFDVTGIVNETDTTFTIHYIVYCVDYPVYSRFQYIPGFTTYENAHSASRTLKNDQSVCCIEEEEQDIKCERTVLNMIWILIPVASLTLTLIIGMVFIVVKYTTLRRNK